MSTGSGFFGNSYILINIAQAASERSAEECAPTESTKSDDPLISIIFSAATAESFVAELAELCKTGDRSGTPSATTFGELYDELESARSSTISKYALAYFLFSGVPLDKGRQPYQDFRLLFDLRNALAHAKLSRIRTDRIDNRYQSKMIYPPIIERLRSSNILADLPDVNELSPWLQVVSTPAVASWSVASCSTMILQIIDKVPEGILRTKLEMYRRKFQDHIA